MPLAPPITDIQQPAVGIYGLPIGASAGPMVQLTAAQIQAIAEVSSPDLSGYAQLSGATFTGNVLLRNGTTAVIQTLEKTFTSLTNREYLYEGYDATAGYPGYHVSSRVGSGGGSNRDLYLGHVSSAGTFTGITVFPSGLIKIPDVSLGGAVLRFGDTGTGFDGSSGILRVWAQNSLIAYADSATIVCQIKLQAKASTTVSASLCIPSGTAPTSPVNGDIWSDGTNLKVRLGGVTYTLSKV